MRMMLRVLTFRFTREDLTGLTWRHLAVGLVFTLLAGIGRYWDHPKAYLLQTLGFGSVIYVFVLAALMYAATRPVTKEFSYFRVLTFITLTSAPALLYAIPVERWMTTQEAIRANIAFLATVALYRLVLMAAFVGRLGRVGPVSATIVALTPVLGIIVLLGILNLEQATFEIMGGLAKEKTPKDATYGFVVGLTVLSFFAAPVFLLSWLYIVRITRLRREKTSAS